MGWGEVDETPGPSRAGMKARIEALEGEFLEAAGRASRNQDAADTARAETRTYQERDRVTREALRGAVSLLGQVIPVLDSHGTDSDLREAIQTFLEGSP